MSRTTAPPTSVDGRNVVAAGAGGAEFPAARGSAEGPIAVGAEVVSRRSTADGEFADPVPPDGLRAVVPADEESPLSRPDRPDRLAEEPDCRSDSAEESVERSESAGLASASGEPIATPMPSATARAPTRPT